MELVHVFKEIPDIRFKNYYHCCQYIEMKQVDPNEYVCVYQIFYTKAEFLAF